MKTKYALFIVSTIFVIVVLPHILFTFSIVPYPSKSNELAILINNATAPTISILTLIGIFLTYKRQQENHRDQMLYIEKEHSFNYIDNIFNKFSDHFLKDLEEGDLKDLHQDLYSLLLSWSDNSTKINKNINGGIAKKDDIEKDKNKVKSILEILDIHIVNFNFLIDEIVSQKKIDPMLQRLYLDKIKILFNKISLKDISQKFKEKEIVENFRELSNIIQPYHQKIYEIINVNEKNN